MLTTRDRWPALIAAAQRGSRGAWLELAGDLAFLAANTISALLAPADDLVSAVVGRTIDTIERELHTIDPEENLAKRTQDMATRFARELVGRRS